MGYKSSKKDITADLEAASEPAAVQSKQLARLREPKKTVRRVNPLGFRVVVRLTPDNNMSEGGLYLPEGAKQNMTESILAEVIEVASAVDTHTDEETNVSGIPLGALVLIPKTAGVKIPWDDDLRVVETKEVLAIVDEVNLS